MGSWISGFYSENICGMTTLQILDKLFWQSNWQWTSCVSLWWLKNRIWTCIGRGENLIFDNWKAHLIVPGTFPFFTACFFRIIEMKAKTPVRAVSFDNELLNGFYLSLKKKSRLSGSWQSSFWTWQMQWRERWTKCELKITYEFFDNVHRESVSVTNMLAGKTGIRKIPSLHLCSNSGGGSSADSPLLPNSSHPHVLGKGRVRTQTNVIS